MREAGTRQGLGRLFARGTGARRPPLGMLAKEAAAALGPLPELVGHPLLAGLPRGDGHPVLILPGFLHGDRSTGRLQRYLASKGYAVHGWDCGINLGPTERVMTSLERRIRELGVRHGRRVSLIGHSLGGIFAREFAKRQPEDVRQVITLCSPFRPPIATNVEILFRLSAIRHARGIDQLWDGLAEPPPVPTLAVYSRSDGICDWRNCMDPAAGGRHRSVEVAGAHGTIASNPAAVREVALYLAEAEAQPEG